MAMEELLPVLPDMLIDRIASESCTCWLDWAATWRQVSKHFRSDDWYMERLGCPPVTRVPSKTCPTIARGLQEASKGAGVLLVHPGVYYENLRISSDVKIIGWGRPGSVTVTGSGFEPAVVFAGLGMSKQQAEILGLSRGDTGEKASVRNIAVENLNAEQAFAVYMQSGAPTLERCDVRGGVWVGGSGADPIIRHNLVHGSRNAGIKMTDHARGLVEGNRIEDNNRQGVLVERGAAPAIVRNAFGSNALHAIAVTASAAPRLEGNVMEPTFTTLEVRRNLGSLGEDYEKEILHGKHDLHGDLKIFRERPRGAVSNEGGRCSGSDESDEDLYQDW